jgi:hypothetical protein
VSMKAKSQRPRGGNRTEPIRERHWRPGAEGPEKATERMLAWGQLHVAIADWHVSEVVT